MPIKIASCEAADLCSAQVPNLGTSTPPSYQFIIDSVRKHVKDNGLEIVEEKYRACSDKSFASGVYILNAPGMTANPEYSLVFAWSGSYTKLLKFHCGFGIMFNNYVHPNSYIIPELGIKYVSRYKGTPDAITNSLITSQFLNYRMIYDGLVSQLETMGNIKIDKHNTARIMGSMYFDSLLNNYQLTALTSRLNYGDDSQTYKSVCKSLFSTMYDIHPRFWLAAQSKVYTVLEQEIQLFNNYVTGGNMILNEPVVTEPIIQKDPAQLDLLTAIEEATMIQESNEEPVVTPTFEDELPQIPEPQLVIPQVESNVSKGDDLEVDISSEESDEKYFDFEL
jgi:hypothetical protein